VLYVMKVHFLCLKGAAAAAALHGSSNTADAAALPEHFLQELCQLQPAAAAAAPEAPISCSNGSRFMELTERLLLLRLEVLSDAVAMYAADSLSDSTRRQLFARSANRHQAPSSDALRAG
jgi:hypothetical protein